MSSNFSVKHTTKQPASQVSGPKKQVRWTTAVSDSSFDMPYKVGVLRVVNVDQPLALESKQEVVAASAAVRQLNYLRSAMKPTTSTGKDHLNKPLPDLPVSAEHSTHFAQMKIRENGTTVSRATSSVADRPRPNRPPPAPPLWSAEPLSPSGPHRSGDMNRPQSTQTQWQNSRNLQSSLPPMLTTREPTRSTPLNNEVLNASASTHPNFQISLSRPILSSGQQARTRPVKSPRHRPQNPPTQTMRDAHEQSSRAYKQRISDHHSSSLAPPPLAERRRLPNKPRILVKAHKHSQVNDRSSTNISSRRSRIESIGPEDLIRDIAELKEANRRVTVQCSADAESARKRLQSVLTVKDTEITRLNAMIKELTDFVNLEKDRLLTYFGTLIPDIKKNLQGSASETKDEEISRIAAEFISERKRQLDSCHAEIDRLKAEVAAVVQREKKTIEFYKHSGAPGIKKDQEGLQTPAQGSGHSSTVDGRELPILGIVEPTTVCSIVGTELNPLERPSLTLENSSSGRLLRSKAFGWPGRRHVLNAAAKFDKISGRN